MSEFEEPFERVDDGFESESESESTEMGETEQEGSGQSVLGRLGASAGITVEEMAKEPGRLGDIARELLEMEAAQAARRESEEKARQAAQAAEVDPVELEARRILGTTFEEAYAEAWAEVDPREDEKFERMKGEAIEAGYLTEQSEYDKVLVTSFRESLVSDPATLAERVRVARAEAVRAVKANDAVGAFIDDARSEVAFDAFDLPKSVFEAVTKAATGGPLEVPDGMSRRAFADLLAQYTGRA